jgi:MinD-like ATPase involved in chromosome partitioning or flagellar assembly
MRQLSTTAVQSGAIQRPLSVLLVDMDVRDGQLGTLLGVFTPTALNIRKAPHIDERVIRRNIIPAEHLGVDVLLAPNRPRAADDVGPGFYRSLIRSLKSMYDVIILDGSVSYLDPLLAGVCVPESSRVLLITTPFKTSVHGVGRAAAELIEPLEAGGLGVPRSKIGVVVNQSTGDMNVDQRAVVAAVQQIDIVGQIPVAAHSDMLHATNSARLDLLLGHPQLGPAYRALAAVCAPSVRPHGEAPAPAAPSAAGAPTAANGTRPGAAPVPPTRVMPPVASPAQVPVGAGVGASNGFQMPSGRIAPVTSVPGSGPEDSAQGRRKLFGRKRG